ETKATLSYNVLLGSGNDEGFAGLWGSVDGGATVKIGLHGEAGNDSLNVFATYVTGYDQVNIGFGGLLDIGLNGGDGNDHLNTTYGGIDRGTLRVREDGAAGNDQVSADIHLVRTFLFPPRQTDASPYRWLCLARAYSKVVSTRAPLAPIGWPRAIAPPWTFTFASSSPSSLPQASIWAANASFSSNRPMSDRDSFALSST